ncbi:hypothetical protein M3Y98_00777700 [Aphelenchoides besseyi]|nr:hypothetical protein M3Y98_00777700 [Aphelenchoides besseyi]KAI6211803.1 hypothetical protein M3Y96_00473100 [Aphelenchoides besseyi]
MNKSFGLFVVLSVALVAVTYGQLSEKLNPLVESKPGFTKCKAEACGTYTSDCSSNPDCDCFKTIDKYGVCILGTTRMFSSQNDMIRVFSLARLENLDLESITLEIELSDTIEVEVSIQIIISLGNGWTTVEL